MVSLLRKLWAAVVLLLRREQWAAMVVLLLNKAASSSCTIAVPSAHGGNGGRPAPKALAAVERTLLLLRVCLAAKSGSDVKHLVDEDSVTASKPCSPLMGMPKEAASSSIWSSFA